jgi:hypothetical protein
MSERADNRAEIDRMDYIKSKEVKSDHGKLAEIAALKANWDSYGAPPIDPVCIEMARRIVEQCPGFFHIVPCCDGTITLERHSDGAEVYCNIWPTQPTRGSGT